MSTAQREEYAAIARRARDLYQLGRSTPDVLRECYGLDLPDEIMIIADSGLPVRDSSVRFPVQPWDIILTAEHTEVPLTPAGSDAVERELLRRDPDLFPLAFLTTREAKHGHTLACYRLSDLAEGRSTVYGVPGVIYRVPPTLDVASETTRRGDSLLAIFREYFVDIYERLRAEADKESAWGTDAIDDEMIEHAEGLVDLMEELIGRNAA